MLSDDLFTRPEDLVKAMVNAGKDETLKVANPKDANDNILLIPEATLEQKTREFMNAVKHLNNPIKL
ncbi:hypothetical protein F3J37_01220 [Pantoea sp. Al-1710]|uniref:Uncharacterized protein n=1 Tax=Candidatus Pantoea communis TaxID=2608354 RepID=A0ABX0RKI2_9GAMM|nr:MULTISPECIES: hypothetical protein [Pantoea]NIG13002.1 hypothetical protein [Pantoea sp. Cy-640]NIG17297.1 hypothetical protein [Pantoea communis]